DLLRLQPADIARDLDGKNQGGGVWANTIGVIRDAVHGRMNPRLHAMRERVAAIYEAHYSKADMRALDTPVHREAVGDSWSKNRILSLALNWGNEDNRDRVLSSARGRLTVEQVGALLQTLDKRDWDFVQAMAGEINSYWPEIRDTWRRRSG